MNLKKLAYRIVPSMSSGSQANRFWDQVQENEQFLYGVALRYTGQPFDAEDLVQQTLEIAFRKYAQLKNPDHFRRWVFIILRNRHLKNRRRSAAKMRQAPLEEQTDYMALLARAASVDPSLLYEQKATAQTVQQALATLPEPYQAVLMLHYMEDYPYREISKILDIPVGTVMSRPSRGKQHLKRALLRRRLKFQSRQNLPKVSEARR